MPARKEAPTNGRPPALLRDFSAAVLPCKVACAFPFRPEESVIVSQIISIVDDAGDGVTPVSGVLVAAVFALAALSGCDRSSSETDQQTTSSASTAEESPESPDTDQSRSGSTTNGHYAVDVVPEPNPIPFQQLFRLKVDVWQSKDRETPARGVSLDQVRARMPAHDHGMKTAPEVVDKGPGAFVVEGMRFHMRGNGEDGRWVLELVLNGEQGIDDVNFEYQCCISQ